MSQVTIGVTVDDTSLEGSTIAENDETEWASGTTYAADDLVMVTSTGVHKIYQSVQGSNLGNDPVTDDGTWWTEISSTNRWKAFDGRVSDQATDTSVVGWTIRPGAGANGASLFNVTADDAELQIEDDSSYIAIGSMTQANTTSLTNDVDGPCIAEQAWDWVEGTGVNHTYLDETAYGITAGHRYMISIWVRVPAADRNLRVAFNHSGTNHVVDFDPVAETGTTVDSSDYVRGVEASTDYPGWYRCYYGFAGIVTDAAAYLRLSMRDSTNNQNYTHDGTSGLEIYGVCIEEYDGAYDDLTLWSASNATLTGATITDTPETNPDARAVQWTDDNDPVVTEFHAMTRTLTIGVGVQRTFSAFVKVVSGTTAWSLSVDQSTDNSKADFTLSGAGTVDGISGFAESASIESVGSGWYLLSLTFTGQAASDIHYIMPNPSTYNSSGANSVYVYGVRSWTHDGPPEYPTTPQEGIRVHEKLPVLRSSQVEDWYTYVFANFDISGNVTFTATFETTANDRVQIGARIADSADAKVGQALVGRNVILGKTLAATEVGARDFSVKETDTFGRATLIPRGYSQEVDYRVTIPTAGAQRAVAIIDSVRATLVGWNAGDATDSYGTTVFGYYDDYDVRLDVGESTINLSVKGAV